MKIDISIYRNDDFEDTVETICSSWWEIFTKRPICKRDIENVFLDGYKEGIKSQIK